MEGMNPYGKGEIHPRERYALPTDGLVLRIPLRDNRLFSSVDGYVLTLQPLDESTRTNEQHLRCPSPVFMTTTGLDSQRKEQTP